MIFVKHQFSPSLFLRSIKIKCINSDITKPSVDASILFLKEEAGINERCYRILILILTFSERNPGITRILTGDALTGETTKLHGRVRQLFDRIEVQLKQILREAEINHGARTTFTVSVSANMLLALTEGRMAQFVRSNFEYPPTKNWEDQWSLTMVGFFRD